jgi:hypothetical protein
MQTLFIVKGCKSGCSIPVLYADCGGVKRIRDMQILISYLSIPGQNGLESVRTFLAEATCVYKRYDGRIAARVEVDGRTIYDLQVFPERCQKKIRAPQPREGTVDVAFERVSIAGKYVREAEPSVRGDS